METAEIVEVFENKVWVEHDILGDAHVMLQSAAPGSEPKCAVTVRYEYPYIDNATRNKVATHVAEMFGAVKPIEFRFRELHLTLELTGHRPPAKGGVVKTETNPGGLVGGEVGRRVVCAANRNPETLDMILGARHFDSLMREAVGARMSGYTEQGFIDQRGVFMTRTEAWSVAAAAGQIIRRCGGDGADGGTLYSENLY